MARPIGERAAETMTASGMASSLQIPADGCRARRTNGWYATPMGHNKS
jgi:hypothetical protein